MSVALQKLLLLASLMLLALPVQATATVDGCGNAENVFQPCDNDISMVFLSSITGNINALAPETAFANFFGILNAFIFNIGLLFLFYTVLTSTVSAAMSGQFIGEEGGLMKAVRTIFGLSLLLSLPSGFAMSQYAVHQVIVAGVGLADTIWSAAIGFIEENSLFINLTPADNNSVSQNKIRAEAYRNYGDQMVKVATIMGCSYRHNYEGTWGQGISQDSTVFRSTFTAFNNPFFDRQQNPQINEYEANGATVTVNSIDYTVVLPNWYGLSSVQTDADTLRIRSGFNRILPNGNPSDPSLVEACGFVEVPIVMENAFYQYAELIKPFIVEMAPKNFQLGQSIRVTPGQAAEIQSAALMVLDAYQPPEPTFSDQAFVGYGWAAAGFYYSRASDPTASSSGSSQVISDSAATNTSAAYANALETAIAEVLDNFASNELNVVNTGSGNEFNPIADLFASEQSTDTRKRDWINFVSWFFQVGKLGQLAYNGFGDANAFISGTEDPFKQLRELGHQMMTDAANLLIAGFSFMLIHIAAVAMCTGDIPLGRTFKITSHYITLLMIFLAMGAYGQGALLAIVLPLIPVLFYVAGVLGWLMAVFEALLAAPLMALGIMWPQEGGHEIWGRSEPGLMILLNIFLRPSLMVVGLLAGIFICWVAFSLLSLTFMVLTSNRLINPDDVIGWLPVGFVYVSLLLTIAGKSFSLIYELPDKILIWMGGQVMSWGKGDELLQVARGGVQQGTKSIEETGESVKNLSAKNHARDQQTEKMEKTEGSSGSGEEGKN